jgi:hypothetical protein
MAAFDPITAVSNVVGQVIDRVWPDPAQASAAKLQLLQLQQTGELAQITGQMQINQVEAASTDPLQHWRGGLGWVCVAGYFWNYVLEPVLGAAAVFLNHPVVLSKMDMSELSTLTLGMLGLGGLHVAERIKGASR